MSNFAQALARIEELQKRAVRLRHDFPFAEIEEIQILLLRYTNSIVQLGKLATEMREDLRNLSDPGDELYASEVSYDKLMNGEEG